MKFRSWWALVLTVVLAASVLSACGGSNDSSGEGDKTSAPPSSSGSPQASGAPTKLTMWDLDSNPSQDSVGVKALKEKFNIEIEYISSTREAMKEKLNLMIMSNTVPDWWKEPPFSEYDKLVQQNVAAEIPQALIEQNMPKYVAWLKRYLGDDPYKYIRRDGKIYGLPVIWDLGTEATQLGFREDWLKKVGIAKTPETLEEMEAALTKFRNEDPDNNGKKDTYGMTASASSPGSMFSSVFGAFDAYPNIFRAKDGKIVRGEIEPGAKQALEVLNRWYKNELIDPEFVVNKGPNVEDKVMGDKIGVIENAWWDMLPGSAFLGGQTWFDKLKAKHPDFSFSIVPGVKGPEGHFGISQYNPAYASGIMFGKQLEKDQAKMIKYMQVFEAAMFDTEIYSKMQFGVEGTHWKKSEIGTIEFIPPYDKEEERKKAGLGSYSMPGSFNDYDFQTSFTADPSLRQLAKDTRAQGSREVDILAPFSKPIYNETQEKLQQLTLTTFVDFITGRKSLNEFDSFVEEWKKMGGDKVLEEAQQIYDQNLKP